MSTRCLSDLAFDAIPSHIAVLDRDGVILRVNEAWRRFARENGCSDPGAYLGDNYLEVCRKSYKEGDELAGDVLKGIVGVASGADASFVQRYPCHSPYMTRWFSMTVTPLGDDSGGVTIAHHDVSALVEAELAQTRLVSELNHRVKNTLAIVQCLAHQTARATPDPSRFTVAFSSRISALAQVHDVLTREAWGGAWMADVVEAALSPFKDGRLGEGRELNVFRTTGPPVLLNASMAVSLSLAVFELATNAAKHGALTRPEGVVDLTWALADDARQVVLDWIECGGPSAAEPEHKGFGSRMLEALAMQGDAKLERDYSIHGLRLRLELPLRPTV